MQNAARAQPLRRMDYGYSESRFENRDFRVDAASRHAVANNPKMVLLLDA